MCFRARPFFGGYIKLELPLELIYPPKKGRANLENIFGITFKFCYYRKLRAALHHRMYTVNNVLETESLMCLCISFVGRYYVFDLLFTSLSNLSRIMNFGYKERNFDKNECDFGHTPYRALDYYLPGRSIARIQEELLILLQPCAHDRN